MKLVKDTLAMIIVILVLTNAVFAQESSVNTIESINVARQGNEIAVRIDLKEPLNKGPAGFTVANPAKVAIDFPMTTNGLGKSTQVVNEGDLTSLNVVQVGDRTRLVFNLVKPHSYTSRIDGKSLYLTLSSVTRLTDAASQIGARFAEESLVGIKHAIRDVSFRRGKDGEARIVVDLSDPGAGVDIRQQGSALVVDFIKTAVPEHLRRNLDVDDFSTPVSKVETRVFGENARMLITPKGLWEHNAYQTDNQFVVEVKRIVEDPNKLVQGAKIGYQGPRISINYQNGDVRALLRLMAEELGLNAIISETVSGTTTLVLKDVPADQVIDIIFQQKGLDMRKKGNIIMIAPRDELATREKLEFESKQQISELEPLKLEQFTLNYQKAVDVARLLAGLPVAGAGGLGAPALGTGQSAQKILSKRGSAVADPLSNKLFVNDTQSKLEEVRAFISSIDISARQVLIEARVVEANDSFNRNLGVRMNFLNSSPSNIGQSGVAVGGGVYGSKGQTTSNTLGINLPTYATSGSAGGAFAISLFNASLTKILTFELAALETDGLGKIVSSPRVMTANNIKATVQDGRKIPLCKTTDLNGRCTASDYFPATLALEVTPQITPDGRVKMKINVKKEEADLTKLVNGQPVVDTSSVETEAIVENGGTVVVGGVYLTSNKNGQEKVPFFGDIPLLGWLFKYDLKSSSRRELLVFVTPRILSDNLRVE